MVDIGGKDFTECLNYAMANGILDISKLVADVEMDKRQEILSNHKYSVWQGVTSLEIKEFDHCIITREGGGVVG